MGGHSAWRKRVAAGEPAKGLGGAIMRHRPHLGRKGKDLLLNRKGNIGGRPNPKRKSRKMGSEQEHPVKEKTIDPVLTLCKWIFLVALGGYIIFAALFLWKRTTK